MKIKSRDIKFFVLGVFAMLLLVVITDWQDVKKSFLEGYNEGAFSESVERH
ncbi:hypothetical protein [Galbibacter mesophilus]|uniref:hypothetical protein n=1 Tax=Galbibacter mesophilus TaxID=379069 RepID=UPI00191DF3F5|nr:hypothetical protein [Galbibacter mesophilus]MCM5662609.1 hypothetical protein [Galbibacter mesophilus]